MVCFFITDAGTDDAYVHCYIVSPIRNGFNFVVPESICCNNIGAISYKPQFGGPCNLW